MKKWLFLLMDPKWCTVSLFVRRLSVSSSRTELIPRKAWTTWSEGLKILKTTQSPKVFTISGIQCEEKENKTVAGA
jgi:hypothetical protein